VVGDVFEGDELSNFASWSEGTVVWQSGKLAVVRALY
jgi:hypothetical protein